MPRTIFLLRHGQTDFNVRGIVQGSGVDSSLNDTGRRQAAQFFAAYGTCRLIRSIPRPCAAPRSRCSSFWTLGLPHESPRRPQRNQLGRARRHPHHHGRRRRVPPQVLAGWAAGDTHARLTGGESPEEVAARQRPFIELLKARADERNRARVHARPGPARAALPAAQLPAKLHGRLRAQQLVPVQAGVYGRRMFTVKNFLDVAHLQVVGCNE